MKFVLIPKRMLLTGATMLVALVLMMVCIGSTASAGVYLGQTSRQMPIMSVETTQMVAALSFDVSFGTDQVPALVAELEREQVRATFFVLGSWAQKNPETLATMAQSSAVELGTHSNTHPDMTKLRQSQVQLELESSIQVIKQITDIQPKLFRAPFGAFSDTVLQTASQLGLMTIQWNIDSMDWQDTPAQTMATKILAKITPGSIIHMHSDAKHTLAALPLIIKGLKNKGYALRAVGDIIFADDYAIDHQGRQTRR